MLEQITLAALAGGKGTRMGIPKGMLQIGSEPILRHLLRQAAWPGPTLLVTSPDREHPPAWQEFGREVADPVANQGPMRGILTALEAAESDYVVISTVDIPTVGHAQFAWLVEQMQSHPNAFGLMLRREIGGKICIEPFPAIFHRTAAGLLRQQLTAAEHSVQRLTSDPHMVLLDAPAIWPNSIWTNLNYPTDLQRYQLMSETHENMPAKTPGTFKQFIARFPALGELHEQIAQAVEAAGPLDAKTLELIKIGISLGAGLESATRAHVRKAMTHGATKPEIEQAILLAYNTCGWPRMVAAWQWAQQQFERGI